MKTVSIRLNKKELWELMSNFGESFQAGADGNEVADRVAKKLSNAYAKLLDRRDALAGQQEGEP